MRTNRAEKKRAALREGLAAAAPLFPDYSDRELFDKGFQMVILANHPMRAAVAAMEQTLETLRTERKAAAVDPHIASVDHIFELVRTKEAIALEESGVESAASF